MIPLFELNDAGTCEAYRACRDHGTKADARVFLEQAWDRVGHLVGDRRQHFLKEFRSNFHAKSWDLYLLAVISEAGFGIEPGKPEGPDICATIGGKRVWIEAVVPTPGAPESADRVFQALPDSPGSAGRRSARGPLECAGDGGEPGRAMTTALPPIILSRLEKAAVDNGFDQELPREGDWLGFASTQCPLRIWLGTFGDTVFLAAFSQQNVARALGEYGTPMAAPMPRSAGGGRTVPDVPALHRLLRRAFQLSKALPNELLHTFEKQVAALPKTTEAERLVIQRVGQNLFRDGLLDLWEGQCAVTGLAVPSLLRASHIKPWADCEADGERLDVYNGILLAPHLDAAFDRGFITVQDDGAIAVSNALDAHARAVLGLERPLRVLGLAEGHRSYLPWHREKVFKRGESGG